MQGESEKDSRRNAKDLFQEIYNNGNNSEIITKRLKNFIINTAFFISGSTVILLDK
jgi:hypothetical protein